MRRRSLPIGALIRWSAVLVAAAVVAWSLPIDDFWLTLASGRAISSGADPTAAMPFSWAPEISGALNPQWAAQLILGAHGSLGLALMTNATLVLAGLFATATRALSRSSALAASVAFLLILPGLAPHLLVRAQSFSIGLFPISLLLLERFSGRRWMPLGYGGLVAVWANLHGGFVVGQLAALAWLVAAVVLGRSLWVPLLTFTAAAIAPVANPVGFELLVYAYGQPTVDVVRAISTEWQPSWPWLPLAIPFWIILGVLAAGRVVSRGVVPVPQLLLLIALALLAASGLRHIPWFLLAAVPVIACDIDRVLSRAPALARAVGMEAAKQRSWSPRWAVPVIALAVIGFQLLRPSLPDAAARLTPDEPVSAVDALAEIVQPGDRVLNEQEWGGYIAYRLWPTVETAMDGRLEIRTLDTWAWYFDLMQGEGDPAVDMRTAGVDWAVLGADRQELRGALVSAGWVITHDDGYATVLRRRDGPPSARQSVP